MILIKGLKPGSLRKIKSAVVTLGVFDGVHAGHRKILEKTVADAKKLGAKSVALTFETHPMKTTHKKAPAVLTDTEKKTALIAATGIDILIVIDFDRKFASIPAEKFITEILVKKLKIKKAVVGFDYRFGKGGSGDASLLKEYGKIFGFSVDRIQAQKCCGGIISSTEIRKRASSGDLRTARRMLGRHYSLTGRIIRGDGRGASIGFPTANLDATNEVVPPEGVYAVTITVCRKTYRGACGIGRPTFHPGEKHPPVEVHVIGLKKKNIYGEKTEVSFIRKLRDTRRFSSREALQRQIARDVEMCRKIRID